MFSFISKRLTVGMNFVAQKGLLKNIKEGVTYIDAKVEIPVEFQLAFYISKTC